MNRRDFYYEQPVTEGELNDAFQGVETAIDQVVQDLLTTRGIVVGGSVLPTTPPSKAIKLAGEWRIRDQEGRRIAWGSAGQTVSLVKDHLGADVMATAGKQRIASVFVAFDRLLSDQRRDGNGDLVQFIRNEGFRFIVVLGAETNINTTFAFPLAPAGYESAIKVADVKIVGNPVEIFTPDIVLTQQQKASINTFSSDVTFLKSMTVHGSASVQGNVSANGSVSGQSASFSNGLNAAWASFGGGLSAESLALGYGGISRFGLETVYIYSEGEDPASPVELSENASYVIVDPKTSGHSIHLRLPKPTNDGKVMVIHRIGDNQGDAGYIVDVTVAEGGQISDTTNARLAAVNETLEVIAFSGRWHKRMRDAQGQTYENFVLNNDANIPVSASDVLLVNPGGDKALHLPKPSACPGKKITIKNAGPLTTEFHLWAKDEGLFEHGRFDNTVLYPRHNAGSTSAVTVISNGTSWIIISKYTNI